MDDGASCGPDMPVLTAVDRLEETPSISRYAAQVIIAVVCLE